MTPDEQHAKYYHDEPSPETLRHFDKLDMQFEKLSEGVETIKIHLEKQDVIMMQILDQTKKTNGRVSCLEEYKNQNFQFIEDLKEDKKDFKSHWRNTVWDLFKVGVIAMISVVVGLMGYREIFDKLVK